MEQRKKGFIRFIGEILYVFCTPIITIGIQFSVYENSSISEG